MEWIKNLQDDIKFLDTARHIGSVHTSIQDQLNSLSITGLASLGNVLLTVVTSKHNNGRNVDILLRHYQSHDIPIPQHHLKKLFVKACRHSRNVEYDDKMGSYNYVGNSSADAMLPFVTKTSDFDPRNKLHPLHRLHNGGKQLFYPQNWSIQGKPVSFLHRACKKYWPSSTVVMHDYMKKHDPLYGKDKY